MVMGYDMYRNLTNTTGKKFKNKQQEVFQQALVNPGPDIVSSTFFNIETGALKGGGCA